MEIPTGLRRRCGRASFVVPALAANLLAAGVPLLHLVSHGEEHGEIHRHGSGHGSAHGDPDRASHPHRDGEVHPPSLHEGWLPAPRTAAALPVALPNPGAREPLAVEADAAPRRAAGPLRSRAPPRAPPARAPPLA
jgi:hypothetical protein